MKVSTRIVLAGVAGFLAACGTLVGPQEAAHAEPNPKFPTCYGAKVSHSQMRIWLNPGTLYDPKSLIVNTVHLERRRDGIWTGIVPAEVAPSHNRWFLAKMDGTEKAFWVKCKKVSP